MDVGSGGCLPLPSPATEDETIARRRSRRVSFAEITAVHVFDRDEDFETPPEERAAAAAASPSPSLSPSLSPGNPAAAEGEETEGEDEGEDFVPAPFRFVNNDVDLSSPGSAAGSLVSNDDEDFFGPVSRSFILSGRPSDSGMSEDGNHDITLDSETFSRHFRSVAPPDDCSINSVGSLRTPNSASTGPLKEQTGSGYDGKSYNSRDALTNMSLLADNPERYDYAKLSPTLSNLLRKVKDVHGPMSPKNGTGTVTPDHSSALVASKKKNREEKSSIGNGISCSEMDTVGSLAEHVPIRNPVVTSTDPIQEDNAMTVNVNVKSQENCNNGHAVILVDVNKNVHPPAMLSPPYKSLTSDNNFQPHLLDQQPSKDQPPGTYCTTNDNYLWPSAVSAVPTNNGEQQQQQNHVMDVEAIPNTPKTVVQISETSQGSISSLRSKRRQLFSPIALSTSNVVSQEASSLGSEFVKHGKRILALRDNLKSSIYESPATHNFRLPQIERNAFGLKPNAIAGNAENHDSTMSVSSNSVPQRHLKKSGQASTLGTPRQELNEVTKIQEMPCNVLIMDDQPSHECNAIKDLDGAGRKRSINENSHAELERRQKLTKAPRSPATSLKQLPCVSLSSNMIEEKQSDAHGSEQSINVDWSKVVFMVSNAMSQVLSTSISKVKPHQLDMIEDMLEEIQRARNFNRLSTAVRIQDCGSDKQKRLAEARSLIDKLLYEKAKLQINHMKLEKLQSRAQVCQAGIQECRYLKSKISNLKGSPRHATTVVTASDRQEGLALITEKQLALNMVKKKVEGSRSSLEFLCSTKGDISCDELIRAAEQHLEMKNQCRIVHQQSWLWELNDLVKRENRHDIILNYCSLLSQRIVLNISDMSIFVNNLLSGTKIDQKFPNLNASVAFSYVFESEVNQRVSGLRSLQKKTMETSLLLGNLIDVLVEIKIAKLELLNLTSAAFDMESQTCQLAFSLCFMNFKRGKIISFTIDMTDLNRAIYPSEPSELLMKVCESNTTVVQPDLDKLMSSLRDLQPGRLMILRLCRMASKLMYELPG
ncbi:uncharacterized protein LOC102715492 isoform X2 [Oryza brachyantha]|uniref:Knl1 C-terminal RWD domain-containing protein n=1 Tax=Oryza brachyantha TaxID=4533 RepID=J3MFP8_ORYBR|nr:uncharacterized protein LOC102715492 isoform X2 [Oryza brachyantha]